jgi:hypothetical protein
MYYLNILKEQVKLSFMSIAIYRANFALMLLQSITPRLYFPLQSTRAFYYRMPCYHMPVFLRCPTRSKSKDLNITPQNPNLPYGLGLAGRLK